MDLKKITIALSFSVATAFLSAINFFSWNWPHQPGLLKLNNAVMYFIIIFCFLGFLLIFLWFSLMVKNKLLRKWAQILLFTYPLFSALTTMTVMLPLDLHDPIKFKLALTNSAFIISSFAFIGSIFFVFLETTVEPSIVKQSFSDIVYVANMIIENFKHKRRNR